MSLWGNAVGAVLEHVLYRSGGTMTGGINMGQNSIEGLKIPTADDQATNKKYVDDSVKVATGAAAGAQATADEAAAAASAAQKTADSKATKLPPFTVSLPASGWAGTSAPYIQTIANEKISKDDCPHYGVIYSQDLETRLKEREAFGYIDELEATDGTLTFTCFEDKPEMDLAIQLEVIR